MTLGPEDAVDVDMTVIGAGPVGLYAAYYAGFRGVRTAILDSPAVDAPLAAVTPAPAGAE
jgi:thioredoxin reductase